MRSGFSLRMSGSDSFGEKNSSLLSIFPAVCYSTESIFWKILLAQQHWRPSHFSMFLNQISKAKLTWGFPDFWQNSGLQLGVWGNLGAIPGHNLCWNWVWLCLGGTFVLLLVKGHCLLWSSFYFLHRDEGLLKASTGGESLCCHWSSENAPGSLLTSVW